MLNHLRTVMFTAWCVQGYATSTHIFMMDDKALQGLASLASRQDQERVPTTSLSYFPVIVYLLYSCCL